MTVTIAPNVVFHGTVQTCEKIVSKHWRSGIGEKASFEERPAGWKYTLRIGGQLIALECDDELQGFEPGTKVKFSMQVE
jgi:hypothetical protein